jgi:hypothetical protein
MKSSDFVFLSALLLAFAAWFAGDFFHQSELWPDMIIGLILFSAGVMFGLFSKQKKDPSWLLSAAGWAVIWLTSHAGIVLLGQREHLYHHVFPVIMGALIITAFLSLFLLTRQPNSLKWP